MTKSEIKRKSLFSSKFWFQKYPFLFFYLSIYLSPFTRHKASGHLDLVPTTKWVQACLLVAASGDSVWSPVGQFWLLSNSAVVVGSIQSAKKNFTWP
jgi:hypothetical protein